MSTATLLEAAKKLDAQQRLELIEQIWESLCDDDAQLVLTPDQARTLQEREERLDRDGPRGDDWATVKARLSARYRR